MCSMIPTRDKTDQHAVVALAYVMRAYGYSDHIMQAYQAISDRGIRDRDAAMSAILKVLKEQGIT